MILLESILDGIRDIKDHFGRTMLQLVGIILGAGSIVATFSLSVAGKSAAMNYYKISGGIQKISVYDKPTGKVTLDAKALASKGLTYHDTVVLKRDGKEIDLVSPVANENMTLRYRNIEKPRSIMGVTPAYSPMNDFHAGSGRFITDNDLATAARVVVLGAERAQEFFGSDDPIGKTMSINGTGYLVVGVMEEKYFSFDHKRNVMRWLNRQIYIPVTTFVTRKGEPLERGKVSFERVREVGTRKAVGASPAQIFFQFLSETILVSVVGGFLGIVVGKFFTDGIAALTRDPAAITVATAVWAIVFAAGTGLVFGMYPA